MLPPSEVKQLARLAHLSLEEDEIQRLTHDLGRILEYVQQLEELNVDNVPPTAMVLVEPIPLRADTPHESLPHELALREAPRTSLDGFAVPGFVEDDG